MSEKKQLDKDELSNISGGADEAEPSEQEDTNIWFKPLDELNNASTSKPVCGSGIGGKDPYNAGPQIFTDKQE